MIAHIRASRKSRAIQRPSSVSAVAKTSRAVRRDTAGATTRRASVSTTTGAALVSLIGAAARSPLLIGAADQLLAGVAVRWLRHRAAAISEGGTAPCRVRPGQEHSAPRGQQVVGLHHLLVEADVITSHPVT